MVKYPQYSVFLGLIIAVVIGVGALSVRASISDRVQGYAWSSNIGWVSLNNCRDANCDKSSSYGVTFSNNSPSIGSGYAWSSNIGWISFGNQGCPTIYSGCMPGSSIDMVNVASDGSRAITGWARACSVYVSGCDGELKPDEARGGWDGFIALSGEAKDGAPFGLKLNADNTISGFGWGADVVGWIEFKGRVAPMQATLAVDLKANDRDVLTVKKGTPVTLSWTVSGNATSCTASKGWSGNKSSTGGKESVGAITTTTTYTISCEGAAGKTSDSVTVFIEGEGALSVTLGASPNPIARGSSTTLSWTVDGKATSCTASGGWSGSKSVTGGSQASGALQKNTLFSITCTGPSGTDTDNVTVRVQSGNDGDTGDGGHACSDGLDNDKDGKIDYTGGPNGEPADPGCSSPTDDDELDIKPVYEER